MLWAQSTIKLQVRFPSTGILSWGLFQQLSTHQPVPLSRVTYFTPQANLKRAQGGEEFEKNEVDWIGKVEISKAEFPTAGKTIKVIFWPTPGFKRENFVLWGSSRLLTEGFSATEMYLLSLLTFHISVFSKEGTLLTTLTTPCYQKAEDSLSLRQHCLGLKQFAVQSGHSKKCQHLQNQQTLILEWF